MIVARASLLALLVCWAFAAHADVAVPPLSGRVVDQTGTLSAGDISSLTQRLKDFEARKGSQVAILIVPTTAPETIEQYSIRVAEIWKIGRNKIDDGVLLVVSKNGHKVRIEVGYGLEGALTDVTSKRIIDEVIAPKFQSGDFAGGISVGVEWIFAVIDGEQLPAPQSRQSSHAPLSPQQSPNKRAASLQFTLFILVAVGATLRTVLGKLVGSLSAAGIAWVVIWYTFGFLQPAFAAGGLAFLMSWIYQEEGWSGGIWSAGNLGSSDHGGSGGEGDGGASGSW